MQQQCNKIVKNQSIAFELLFRFDFALMVETA
jgi:hypothetical protein